MLDIESNFLFKSLETYRSRMLFHFQIKTPADILTM